MILAYIENSAIALDQLINAVVFFGSPDETLSARCYRNRHNSWYWLMWYWLINCIFFLQENHCYESYLSERLRRQLPKDYQ